MPSTCMELLLQNCGTLWEGRGDSEAVYLVRDLSSLFCLMSEIEKRDQIEQIPATHYQISL
jgi:hypothetical protein